MGLIQVSELENSISERASAAVIHKLFIELERLAHHEEHDKEWFNDVFSAFRFISNIETGFGHAKAFALAVIRKNWDDLPIEIRKQYGFAFMNFAKLITNRDESTINNYTRVAEVWFLEKAAPKHQIKVVDRDEHGKPKDTHHFVEFSPYQVDMSKLLALNAKAGRGTVTEQEWEMLVDETYSCDDLHKVMRGNVSHDEPISYWYIEGITLCYKDHTNRIPVAEINFEEYESNEDVKKAIDKLLSILSIKMDSEYIYREFKREFIPHV